MNSLSAGLTLPVGLKSLDGTEHYSAGKEPSTHRGKWKSEALV